jgi:uncharacterized Tic20 family protein
MTQNPGDEPVKPVPPVYGTPAPEGPPPVPPPPPPGYRAPDYGTPGPPPAAPGYGPPTHGPPAHLPPGASQERQWAMLAHLGGLLAIYPVVQLLPALVILSVYRTRSEFVQDQAREALNFQIVVLIIYMTARILGALPLFPNLVVLVWLFSLVFSVIAAVAASRGERYRYPLTFRFLK